MRISDWSSDVCSSDLLTPRAGRGVLHLANGDTLEVACDRSDAILMHVRGYTAVDTIGTARMGDRVGLTNLEVSRNAGGGTALPRCTLGSNATGGLSPPPRPAERRGGKAVVGTVGTPR